MPNYNTESLTELAKPVVNPVPDIHETNAPSCQPGDVECMQRWIAAFSDCSE